MPAVRERREELGLSQAELARAAGLSRALVGAVERGRHAPSVSAALAIARVLDTTVEDLFGAGEADTVHVLAGDLPHETAVRLGRVGDQAVYAHTTHAGPARWTGADGRLTAGRRIEAFAGARSSEVVVAGCEPALGIAEGLLGRRLLSVSATTGQAIDALADGRCHAVTVHGRSGALPEPPRPVHKQRLACWRVGLASHLSLGTPSLDALLASDTPIVHRPPGAASEQALAAVTDRPAPADAPTATGHLDAARAASLGRCAAVTYEPAARALDLHFIELETHVVELWIDARHADEPAVQRLAELLASRPFTQRLAALDGYDLS